MLRLAGPVTCPGSPCGQQRPEAWAGPPLAAQDMSPSAGKVSGQTGSVSGEHLLPRHVQAGGWAGLAFQGHRCSDGVRPGQQHPDIPAPPRPWASVQPPFRASGHSEWAVGPVGAIREHKAEGLAARDVAGEAST